MKKDKIQQVICKSGIVGYQCNLQDSYDDFDQFNYYAENFNLHRRLGYETPIKAWKANPLIQGSVVPNDFRRVQ